MALFKGCCGVFNPPHKGAPIQSYPFVFIKLMSAKGIKYRLRTFVLYLFSFLEETTNRIFGWLTPYFFEQVHLSDIFVRKSCSFLNVTSILLVRWLIFFFPIFWYLCKHFNVLYSFVLTSFI